MASTFVPGASFTAYYVFRIDSIGAVSRILSHLGGIVLAVNSEGVLRMGGSNTGISGGTVIPSRWYVFAITFTGTTATINFNDALTTSTALTRGANPGYSSLGAAPDGSTPLFGALRDVIFYPTVHNTADRENMVAALRSWYTAA
ncbi:hypothetical protein B0T42_12610 [Rathayibacter sp. VKM Ac-2630]|nr:hypothetical protein B0T42_12610 [Rathayibacter sp. VKM Ac-2630]